MPPHQGENSVQCSLWVALVIFFSTLGQQVTPAEAAQHHSPCQGAPELYTNSGSNEDPILKANNVTLIPYNVSNPLCHQYISNGKDDLVGSQLSGRLSVYAYVRSQSLMHNHADLHYVHVPLHWHPKSCCNFINDEFRQVEEMFNLGADELSYFTLRNKVVCVAKHCDAHEGRIGTGRMWGPSLLDIRRKYWSSPVPKPPLPLFKLDHINVVVHIRRGDINKSQKGRWTELDDYLPWFKIVEEALVNLHGFKLRIIVVSEGKVSDFETLTKVHPELVFNLGDTRMASMHQFVAADVLFMAKSTFSGIPALYNDGIVVVQPWLGGAQPWWFKTNSLQELEANFRANSTRQLLSNRLLLRSSSNFG